MSVYRRSTFGGKDLKTQSKNTFIFEMNGYTFYVSNKYEKHPEKRNECIPNKKVTGNKNFGDNKITFQVKDPIPIDYIDKMDDKDRELNL